jgi:hypothetical protein
MDKLPFSCIASDSEKLFKFKWMYGLAIYEVVGINVDRYCPGEVVEINSQRHFNYRIRLLLLLSVKITTQK